MIIWILFFTGTRQQQDISHGIADSLGDELLNMNERIKAWDTSEISADGRLVFCRSDLRLAHSRALSKSG